MIEIPGSTNFAIEGSVNITTIEHIITIVQPIEIFYCKFTDFLYLLQKYSTNYISTYFS